MNNIYVRGAKYVAGPFAFIFFGLSCFAQSHLHFALYSGKGVG